MDTYRKTNVAFLLITIALLVVAVLAWFSSCFSGVCREEFELGLLQPLMYASVWLGVILTIFLFFDTQYFRHWLTKIFSWLSVFGFIVIVEAFPTSFYGQDYANRNVAVNLMGFLTLFISIGFLIFLKYKDEITSFTEKKGNVLYLDEARKTAKWLMVIVFSFFLYLFTPLYCGGQHYCSPYRDTISTVLFGLLLCIPVITYLLSFNVIVFLRWVRHIAWWYAIFLPWALGDESNGFLISGSEVIVTGLMIVLFVITLFYAPITSRNIRKTFGLPGAGIWQFRFATTLFLISMIGFVSLFIFMKTH